MTKGIYLVDSSHGLNAILADDNGVYSHDGSPTNLFFYENEKCITAHKSENIYFIKERAAGRTYLQKNVDQSRIFNLQRIYRRHSFHKAFINIVCKITDVNGNLAKYFLVINHWESVNPESNFVVPCHGNAKQECAKATPFLRTEKAVLLDLKEKIENGKAPKNAYHDAVHSTGNPLVCSSQSKAPRNKKQVIRYINWIYIN